MILCYIFPVFVKIKNYSPSLEKLQKKRLKKICNKHICIHKKISKFVYVQFND